MGKKSPPHLSTQGISFDKIYFIIIKTDVNWNQLYTNKHKEFVIIDIYNNCCFIFS